MYPYVGCGGVGLYLPQGLGPVAFSFVRGPPFPPQVGVWPGGVAALRLSPFGSFGDGFAVDVVEGVWRGIPGGHGGCLEFSSDDCLQLVVEDA